MNYADLPTYARRMAKKMAKDLLRTVPAAEGLTEDDFQAYTLRGALSTIYMRPENVIAVLIYSDGNGNWWGDVVLKVGKDGHTQSGTPMNKPVSSPEEAIEHVKAQIALIKSRPEHPLVKKIREAGFDPERIGLLRITHPKFGTRWMKLDIEAQQERIDQFKKYVEDTKFITWNEVDVINWPSRLSSRWCLSSSMNSRTL